jgi:hypothetical protein
MCISLWFIVAGRMNVSIRIPKCELPKGLPHGNGLPMSLTMLEIIQKCQVNNEWKGNEKNV